MHAAETVRACAKTDRGYCRENNEDRFLIIDRTAGEYDTDRFGFLYAVADGMGGHAAGEVASTLACEGMRAYYREETEGEPFTDCPEAVRTRLERVIQQTHRRICRQARENPDHRGMGTTLTVLVLLGESAIIGHVGDSRAYRFRQEGLDQLTIDQTEVQQMVSRGHLTPEQAQRHPMRNVLSQAVGVQEPPLSIFFRVRPVLPGDVYLLCSDGLHDMLRGDDIYRMLKQNPDPEKAAERLVAGALERGGRDNITVVVITLGKGISGQ